MGSQHLIFKKWLKSHNLPEPTPEYAFHPTRKWRFDYAWPTYRVALEIEGGVFGYTAKDGTRRKGAHASITGIKRDIEKYSEAAAEGWLVVRTLPDNLHSREVVDRLRRALSQIDALPFPPRPSP